MIHDETQITTRYRHALFKKWKCREKCQDLEDPPYTNHFFVKSVFVGLSLLGLNVAVGSPSKGTFQPKDIILDFRCSSASNNLFPNLGDAAVSGKRKMVTTL